MLLLARFRPFHAHEHLTSVMTLRATTFPLAILAVTATLTTPSNAAHSTSTLFPTKVTTATIAITSTMVINGRDYY